MHFNQAFPCEYFFVRIFKGTKTGLKTKCKDEVLFMIQVSLGTINQHPMEFSCYSIYNLRNEKQ